MFQSLSRMPDRGKPILAIFWMIWHGCGCECRRHLGRVADVLIQQIDRLKTGRTEVGHSTRQRPVPVSHAMTALAAQQYSLPTEHNSNKCNSTWFSASERQSDTDWLSS